MADHYVAGQHVNFNDFACVKDNDFHVKHLSFDGLISCGDKHHELSASLTMKQKRGYQFLRSSFVDYKLQLRFMPPALS
jgi:hypothetical protein